VVTADGITFFHVFPNDAVEAGLRLARTWRPSVIHMHTSWLWPIAEAIRAACGAPIVFTVHSLDRAEYEWGGFVSQWEPQEAVINAVDRVIAISESERALMLQYCPAVARRVRIVGNGIDDTPFARAAAIRPRMGPPLLMFSGRFVDRKGIGEMLAGLPRVLEAAPGARAVLVGGHGGAEEMENRWLTGTLRHYRATVRFTGWLSPENTARWYSKADVLIVPSWYEPFGMVILEGMLYGLAIAAAAVGGPAEILEHETTGLFFPARDVDGLVTAVSRLIHDARLRCRLGAAAAAEVRRRWLWPALVDRMRTVYREVMSERRRASVRPDPDGSP
jgi:glycogen(starch) synthase